MKMLKRVKLDNRQAVRNDFLNKPGFDSRLRMTHYTHHDINFVMEFLVFRHFLAILSSQTYC
jgi:hypothetical protein